RDRGHDAVKKLLHSTHHRLKAQSKLALALGLCRRVSVGEDGIDCLADARHVFRRVGENAERADLVLRPVRQQLVKIVVMKIKRLFVTAGVDATNDELDTLVVNRTLQRDALSRSKTIKSNELLSDHRSLPVVDECLPVSV